MSSSHSPRTALYASASSANSDYMAQTLLASTTTHLTTPNYPRPRTSHGLQLPPLSIPPPPRSEWRHEEDAQPPRLPSFQSLTGRPTAAPQSIAGPSRRLTSGPALPLADLLSPQPSDPNRSDVGVSPRYEFGRSPPRSHFEALPHSRHDSVELAGHDTPSGLHRYAGLRNSHAEVPAALHSRQALIPSPTFEARQAHWAPIAVSRTSIESPALPAVPAAPSKPYRVSARTDLGSAASTKQAASEKTQLQYELHMRQQPIAARACGFGERDRRVIDPPPIVQLIARDPRTGTVSLDELRYSLNIVHCTLWSEDGRSEQTALQQPDRRTTRRLMGQLVASPSVAKDEHDVEGCFFCFPDLSCRTHGRYRLRFVLIRLDPTNLHVGSFSPIITEVLSEAFSVYTAKDFPGMRPSSALTRALKLQGCNIQVKKGNDRALVRKRPSFDSNEDRDEAGRMIKRWKDSA